MKTERCRGAAAFSFIEILVAAAILAVAFVPIAGLLQDSFGKVSDQRMEAAAASFAAQVMNDYLFNRPYAEIEPTADRGGVPMTFDFTHEDGVDVRCELFVYEVAPGSGNQMTFEYRRIPYHNPAVACASGSEGAFASGDGTNEAPRAADLDSKYQSGTPVPPLKTLHLTVRWKGRWEAWPATGSPEETRWERTRTRHLVTRRANLE